MTVGVVARWQVCLKDIRNTRKQKKIMVSAAGLKEAGCGVAMNIYD